MAETSLFCKIHPQPQPRPIIVSKIMHIFANANCITRGCVSLAITTFDKYDLMCPQQVSSLITLLENHWFLAIACIGLAYKFQEGKKFKYSILLEAEPTLEQSDESIAKILKLERIVFKGIKWNIPAKTAYNQLEEAIPLFDNSCKKGRRKILICLKILMTAYILGPEASLHPEFGSELLYLAHKKGEQSWVHGIYQRCVDFLEKEENEKGG